MLRDISLTGLQGGKEEIGESYLPILPGKSFRKPHVNPYKPKTPIHHC